MSTLQLASNMELLRERARQVRALRADGISLSARQVPVEPENGDFVALAQVAPHRWLIAIGDVMGHGHEAAQLAEQVCELVEDRARHGADLGDIAACANDLVFELTDGDRFVSMLLLLLDGRAGSFRIANAGHEVPLAVGRGGGVVALEGHGPALGVIPGAEFHASGPIRMARGMIMLAATDGVIDALDADGNRYGRHRASMALAENRHLGPKAVVRRVMSEAEAHATCGDDRTVVALQFV